MVLNYSKDSDLEEDGEIALNVILERKINGEISITIRVFLRLFCSIKQWFFLTYIMLFYRYLHIAINAWV